MVSTPKMEYQVFLCTFQKKSAMAILGLKEMEKFFWEGMVFPVGCLSLAKLNWDSQLGKLFSQPTQRNFPISFKRKVATAKFIGKMWKKIWYYEKLVGRHASFPPRRSVKVLPLNFAESQLKFSFWDEIGLLYYSPPADRELEMPDRESELWIDCSWI